MTEEEWRAGTVAGRTISSLDWSARKVRLFAAACCRLIEPLMTGAEEHEAIAIAERHAEGTVSSKERRAAFDRALTRLRQIRRGQWAIKAAASTLVDEPAKAAWMVCTCSLSAVAEAGCDEEAMRREHAALALDIFRPITLSPSWLTPTVVSLAKGMYESRDFSAMPILADALQDNGCDDESILSHCRGNTPHARGCAVVDAILQKS